MENYKRIKKSLRFSGITLIELITVIAIIASLATAGFISFTSSIGDRLDADARKLVSDLCWARQVAVSTHQNYIVDFDVVNERYTIYRGSIAVTNQIKTQNLVVDLVSVAPVPAQITFSFPQGIPAPQITKDITLSYQGRTKQVRVFGNTGYVRIL